MNTLDGLGVLVLKYHAHILNIKKKNLLQINNQHEKFWLMLEFSLVTNTINYS